MGVDRVYPYPKWVWSPAGGWWYNPRHWQRNTMLVGAGVGVFALSVYSYVSAHENYIDIRAKKIVWSRNDPRYYAERLANPDSSKWVRPLGKQPFTDDESE